MDEVEAVVGLAVGTQGGLGDLALLYVASAVFLQTKHWMCFKKKTLLMTISRAGMTFWH